MNNYEIRIKTFKYLTQFGKDIRTKLDNICGKTGQYDVPIELFQKRTKRSNRAVLTWKTVQKNKLTIEQLETFSGGVVVEFVNEDYLAEDNQSDSVFIALKNLLGSDNIVSSIISIRSESGDSSSNNQRENFEKLMSNTKIHYDKDFVIINKKNYQNYALRRTKPSGTGNDNWSGFLYVSIKGGQQDTIETHDGESVLLFNPACEFATEEICIEIDLVSAYFAMMSIPKNKREKELILDIEKTLEKSEYESKAYTGNLLDYCKNHPCLKMCEGELYDIIQVEPIKIEDFGIKDKENLRNIDFTHDEAVNKDRYYWDTAKNCILTPARPTNIFWSRHLSNMMQQNFSLEEYFRHEIEISERRKKLLK